MVGRRGNRRKGNHRRCVSELEVFGEAHGPNADQVRLFAVRPFRDPTRGLDCEIVIPAVEPRFGELEPEPVPFRRIVHRWIEIIQQVGPVSMDHLQVGLDRGHAEGLGRGELDTGVVVGVPRSAVDERSDLGGPQAEQAQHVDRTPHLDAGQIDADVEFHHPGADRVQIELQRPFGPQQQQVHAVHRFEQHDVGEGVVEGRDDRSQVLGRQVVGLDPLGEDAALANPRARHAEEVLGEQIRRDRHPRVRRLGDDHVVVGRREFEFVAGVVDRHLHPRVVQHVVVGLAEQACRRQHLLFDLDDADVPDRVRRRGADGDATGEADDQDFFAGLRAAAAAGGRTSTESRDLPPSRPRSCR